MTNISITIREKDLIVKDGDRFIVSREGEEVLARFIELKRKVEEAEEKLKELIKKKMDEEKITKIEGENIKIMKRSYGYKYKIVNEEQAKASGVVKIREYVNPDTKAIEEYAEETGLLPDGIGLNEREEQVVISLVGENEDKNL